MPFISYAQNLEDVILSRVFKSIEKGFYIDVGAQDPIRDSVTNAFYERGWRGINIEPAQQYYQRLCSDRKEDINLPVAASSDWGLLPYYEIADSGLSTLDKTLAEKHQKSGWKVDTKRISLVPLSWICKQHAKKPIHFLKIDTEGTEKQVLTGMDFKNYRPWVVLVEAIMPCSQKENHQEWEDILLTNGYQFSYFDGLNRFYTAEEKAGELSVHFKSPPNIFDYYNRYSEYCTEQAKLNLEGVLQKLVQENQQLAREIELYEQKYQALANEKRPLLKKVKQQLSFAWNNTKKELENLAKKYYPAGDAANSAHKIHPPWERDEAGDSLAEAFLKTDRKQRILIDVSYLAQLDQRGGITRVVKRIAEHLSQAESNLFTAIPVRLRSQKLFECEKAQTGPAFAEKKLPAVTILPGDILLMLDSSWLFYDCFAEIFAQIRSEGGKIYTVIYDLIPVLYPYLTISEIAAKFPGWLQTATQNSDGLITISRTVADELAGYIRKKELPFDRNLSIGYFHLGADIEGAAATAAIRPEIIEWFANNSNIFLAVGWLDRRKGQDFALDAFEALWQTGIDACLVFAGKEGWNREELVHRILSHPQYGKRLYWANNPSDEEILYCYNHSTALIFPSLAEGFGIPIIEAAYHGLPVICSDIPVFREIAGDFATYFSLESPLCLANTLQSWLSQPLRPDITAMPKLTWEESARKLTDVILKGNWYKVLPPPENSENISGRHR